MRAVVIGGRGKVGTYLIPMLSELGYDVVNVSRGKSNPFLENSAWSKVEQVALDREREEANGTFGTKIAELNPDIVIDMICFTPESMMQLIEALRGKVRHYLCCGSAWIHGYSSVVPCHEFEDRNPLCEYGKNKLKMEEILSYEYAVNGFPGTIVHPGHIVGAGHMPVNPAGNKNPQVFEKLMHGEELLLPNFGMETLHHVHASDVAQVFIKAILNPNVSYGQGFHAVSSGAVTLRGYADAVASWFSKKAMLKFVPFNEWEKANSKEDVAMTLDHILHSPNYSIDKARKYLGYEPRYTSLEAIKEAVFSLIESGELK